MKNARVELERYQATTITVTIEPDDLPGLTGTKAAEFLLTHKAALRDAMVAAAKGAIQDILAEGR